MDVCFDWRRENQSSLMNLSRQSKPESISTVSLITLFFVFCRNQWKDKQRMKVWLETVKTGQKGQTRGVCIDVWNGRTWGGQGISQMFFYWPVSTERGQGEGITVQGILWKGTNTWCTGNCVCVIIWRLQQPHRDGGRKYGVREE